jgi:hypothetical protein
LGFSAKGKYTECPLIGLVPFDIEKPWYYNGGAF